MFGLTVTTPIQMPVSPIRIPGWIPYTTLIAASCVTVQLIRVLATCMNDLDCVHDFGLSPCHWGHLESEPVDGSSLGLSNF